MARYPFVIFDEQGLVEARRRMTDNTLSAAIRRGVCDERWSELMTQTSPDDLRRLIELDEL